MEVRNTYYPVDSLIKLNNYNGVVDITGLTVNGFSSCGSVIRNFEKVPLVDMQHDPVNNSLDEFANQQGDGAIGFEVWVYMQSFYYLYEYEKTKGRITDHTDSTADVDDLWKISITSSAFKYFGKFKNNYKLPLVSKEFGMDHYGQVLGLHNFKG